MVQYEGLLNVDVNYDGVFAPKPLNYHNGLLKKVTDVDFAGFDFSGLREFLKRSYKDYSSNIYYCMPGENIVKGLRLISGDSEYAEFVNQGYKNGGKISLYLDKYHESLLEWIADEPQEVENIVDETVESYVVQNEVEKKHEVEKEPQLWIIEVEVEKVGPGVLQNEVVESYVVQNGEVDPDVFQADDVQHEDDLPFDHEPEPQVAPCNYTARDPFLSKLSSKRVITDTTPQDIPVDDDDTHSIDDDFYPEDSPYRIQKNVVYPMHDPNQPWDEMKPLLGTRFESPSDLKFMMANYGVANGYQLGYQKNDYKYILCLCGEEARNRRLKKGEEPNGVPVKHCPFRLWASWMSSEHSFQIKTLNPRHTCSRKYDLGALVTYVWIAKHLAPTIIEDPHISIRALQADVISRFHIKVSKNQCRRAKIRALYDLEGGLTEHYARVRDYAYEILRSNPGSTVKIGVNVMPDETTYFSRFYVCFKGVRDGWKAGCRKVVGLDGCFLRGPVKGELLAAVGRDANNQIYPISWAVVSVENKDNWKWFVQLLMNDLDTPDGRGLTLISDQHKGLVEACKEDARFAEHRQCARHIYANFKKKFSGVHFRRLFWEATFSSIEGDFERVMNRIKTLDTAAYNYLMERNPRSWCRAFQQLNKSCAAVENGICESFNSVIGNARGKVMITMLEEIRVFVMQRLFNQRIEAHNWEDDICPSIRKQLNLMQKRRRCNVIQAGVNQFEATYGQEQYHVNLENRTCACNMWQLSGIPCIHVFGVLGHLNIEPASYVSNWFKKEKWLACYSHEMTPMNGSNYWKKVDGIPPLPPKGRKLPGRPKKKRIRHPTEREDGRQSLSRQGREMTCQKCWKKGHNRATCRSEQLDPPVVELRKPGRKRKEPMDVGCSTSHRGRGGTSSRGGANARGGTNARGGANVRGGASARGGANVRGGTSARGGANARGGTSARGGIVRGGKNVSGKYCKSLARRLPALLDEEDYSSNEQPHMETEPGEEMLISQPSQEPVLVSTQEPTQEPIVAPTQETTQETQASQGVMKKRMKSERILKRKLKNFPFDKDGLGASSNKPFTLE